MKKDKEWLKGLINEEGVVMDMHLLGRHDGQYWKNENIKINKGRLFYLIDQLDEPQKPVIPQFVADYIEKWKHDGLSLNGWFTFDYGNDGEKKVSEWLRDNDDETKRLREFTLIDAIRYGYEVEKEKKYRVVFRSHKDDLILFKTGEHIFIGAESANDGYWKQHFTEAEIKDYDERYWAFAEEVKE